MNTIRTVFINGEPLTVDGISFRSVAAVAKHYHVPYGRLIQRLDKGIKLVDAVKQSKQAPNQRSITINGVTYPSLKAVSRAFKINHSTFVNRLKQGWTPEQAIIPAFHRNTNIVATCPHCNHQFTVSSTTIKSDEPAIKTIVRLLKK